MKHLQRVEKGSNETVMGLGRGKNELIIGRERERESIATKNVMKASYEAIMRPGYRKFRNGKRQP